MSKTLLIVTSKWDSHADRLIEISGEELPEWNVVRLHPENFATNVELEVHINSTGKVYNSRALVCDSGRKFKEPDVIWWRKPDWPQSHPSLEQPDEQTCSRQEYKELLLSFQGIFPNSVWLNDYWSMQEYSYKINQIQIAAKNGMKIPETLIPRSVKSISNFKRKHGNIIAKSMRYDGFIADEKFYSCFTNTVTDELISNLTDEDFAFAPLMVQKQIQKQREFRVTVIGESVFWCLINTAPDSAENIDFRIVDPFQLEHQIIEMPKKLSQKLLGITKEMKLNYGAFDIIEDENGDYFMLEINPNGQYLWIELITGAPLTKSICALIKQLSLSKY